jgi:hypothetical protein
LYQYNNPLSFNFVTGNGKIGALVSPSLENSFFGNRSIEIDELTQIRKINKIQYENKKLNFGIGAKIYSQKYWGLDLGLSLKRNPDIQKLNPGVGFLAHLTIFQFGAYFYRDDIKFDLKNYFNPYTGVSYTSIYGKNNYQEAFNVATYTIGTGIKNLSLDAGMIKTKYKFYSNDTQIYLYSSSFVYKSFLFNYSKREEYSPNLDFINNQMVISRKKIDDYYGIQYFINRHFIVGLQDNNFLLNEWSWTLTTYF